MAKMTRGTDPIILNQTDTHQLCRLLDEVIDEFRDALKREPQFPELVMLFFAVCGATTASVFADMETVTLFAVELRLPDARKPQVFDQTTVTQLPDLSDGVYVAATAWLVEGAALLARASGAQPTADQLVATTLAVGHRYYPSLIPPITAVRARTHRPGRVPVRIGDVVAVPADSGTFFFLIVVAINRFGTAFGVFLGRHPLTAAKALERLPRRSQIVYSGSRLIKAGRWKIVAHQPRILEFFPSDPEIYHAPALRKIDARIGPFGSAETSDGAIRPLSCAEAQALGVSDGSYEQAYLSEDLEVRLAQWSADLG